MCNSSDFVTVYGDFNHSQLAMYISLAARICLALIFLHSGRSHLNGFQDFVETISNIGLPFLPAVPQAIGSIICLLAGSISLLLGFQTKIGACLLIFFLVPTTLMVHPPTGDLIPFLKNLALVGGLLMVIESGPGFLSVDAMINRS